MKIAETTTTEHKKNTETVYTILAWYRDLPADFNDIDTLVVKRRQMNYFFGMIQKFRKEQNQLLKKAHVTRRLDEAKKARELQAKDDKATGKRYTGQASKEDALLLCTKQYQEEYELEGTVEGIKYIAEAVQDALNSMRQDISILRKEKEEPDQHSRP